MRPTNVSHKIPISPSLIDDLEKIYAPPDHPVFELVPPAFESRAVVFYANMGNPVITHDTFWATYQQLLQHFLADCPQDQRIQHVLASHEGHCRSVAEEDPGVILPGLKKLRNAADAVGPAAGMINDESLVFVEPEYAEFSDLDDEADSYDVNGQ